MTVRIEKKKISLSTRPIGEPPKDIYRLQMGDEGLVIDHRTKKGRGKKLKGKLTLEKNGKNSMTYR